MLGSWKIRASFLNSEVSENYLQGWTGEEY